MPLKRWSLALAAALAAPWAAACSDPTTPRTDAAAGVDAGADVEASADASADTSADIATAADSADTATDAKGCTTALDCPAPALPCRLAVCAADGSCTEATAADGANCAPSSACILAATCQAGACIDGAPRDCADGAPCTADSCDAASGLCTHVDVVGPCNDGDACTANTSCQAGVCVPSPLAADNLCQSCKSTSDCTAFDDGSLCNGVRYCDTEASPPQCKINPSSVVQCPQDAAKPCHSRVCVDVLDLAGVATNTACVDAALADTSPCDDGLPLSIGDVCIGGLCQGTWTGACKLDADCKDDGDLCNGTPFCNLKSGACELNPATVVSCSSAGDTACSKQICVAATGACAATAAEDGAPCDDGDACTPDDHCQSGTCKAAKNLCCQVDGDCANAEDGDLCNGTLYCNPKIGQCAVNPTTVISCPQGGVAACNVNACAAKTGACAVVPLPDGVTCDADGTACTPNDACKQGSCQVDATEICLCQTDADCKKVEDGDLCNGTLYCDKAGAAAVCKVNAATVVSCPTVDDSACIRNLCQPKLGTCALQKLADATPCSDGDACSGGDACKGGACVADAAICACAKSSDCAKFEDGDACNGALYCDLQGQAPACKVNPATLVVCPKVDDSDCQRRICTPKTGLCPLVPLPNGATCTDAGPCAVDTACSQGACIGKAKGCDDSDACTADSCDKKSGCVALPLAASACDDGAPCTADGCDKKGGCQHAAKAGACDDGDACTGPDSCQGGACGGGKKSCDDGNSCTADSCDKELGCQASKLSGAPCSSGPCVQGESCEGGVCKGGGAALFAKTFGDAEVQGGGMFAVWALPNIEPDAPGAMAGLLLPTADGGAVIGGMTQKAGFEAFLLRVDAAGGLVWQKAVGAGQGVALQGLGAGNDGAILAVGWVAGVQAQPDGMVARLDASGATTWATTVSALRSDELRAVVDDGAQGAVAAGTASCLFGVGCRHWLARVDKAGKLLWEWGKMPTDAADGGLTAIARRGAGVIAAGAAGTALTREGFELVAAALDGKVAWRKQLRGAGAGAATGLHVFADGSLIAIGYDTDTGGSVVGRAVQLGADDALQWSRTFGAAGSTLPLDLAAADAADPKAGVVVVGRSKAGFGKAAGFVARLDRAQGEVQWLRNVGGSADQLLGAVATRPGGKLWATGWTQAGVKDSADLLLLALDAFGYGSCAASGACAGKAALACDDGKVCTADDCAVPQGCASANHVGPCDDGDACTASGTCAGGACQKGSVRFGQTTYGELELGLTAFDAVLVDDYDGRFLIGTRTYAVGQGGGAGPVLGALSAQGVKLWALATGDAVMTPYQRLAITPGGWYSGLRGPFSKGKLLVTTVDRHGKNSGEQVIAGEGDAYPVALIHSAFNEVIALSRHDAGKSVARLTSVDCPTAQVVGSVELPLEAKHIPHSLARRGNGQLFIGGMVDGGPTPVGFLLRVDDAAEGKTTLAVLPKSAGVGAFVLMSRGESLLLGTQADVTTSTLLLGLVDPAALTFQESARMPMLGDSGEYAGLAYRPDVGLLMVDTAKAADSAKGFVEAVHLDLDGHPRWRRFLPPAGAAIVNGAALAADGSVALVGAKGGGPWLGRLDRFGNLSCIVGACADTPLAACADGDACSSDGCDDKAGCAKAAFADGTSCDDGKACATADLCVGGSCKACGL